MVDWAALERPLVEAPLFLVEPPDGRKTIAELPRQTTLLARLRVTAPGLSVWANANAGKRDPRKAKAEGIRSGLFDVSMVNRETFPRFRAELEMKGYDARGRAGSLSDNQIEWGNGMHRAGWPVACFFSPDAAIDWLRSLAPWAFIDREMRL